MTVKLTMLVLFIAIGFGFADELPNPPPAPGEQGQPIENTRTNKGQKANEPNNLTTAPSPANLQLSTPVSSPQVQQPSSQPSQPSSDNRIVFLTFGLLIVAIIQACIYGRQARHMREGLDIARDSTDAAQLAADVAKQSVDLVVQHERPWVMVAVEELNDWTSGDQIRFQVKCSLENVGKSPAFVTKIFLTMGLDDLNPPNKRPTYGDPQLFTKFILPPNGTHEERRGMGIGKNEMGEVNGRRKCIAFWGIIEYHTMENAPCLTRFYAYWQSRGTDARGRLWTFYPVGPPETTEYA